ncbi:SGNH/GDSL hydrolase family protein, partial [Porcipelethomonas sp.]|uniref:SGNH/GDSL hydrolase family protein n=1 Tax=Porcipelethomonas sp. TaxID=2981675 RepID=UPI003EF5E937
MKIKFKFLVSIITSFSLIMSCLLFSSAEENESNKQISIMPLGDSITHGYFGTDGYRKYLYHELDTNGYNIDMVGANNYGSWRPSYTDSNGVTFEYDGDHSGYSGYAIQHITGTETREGILEKIQETDMIATYNPDIVLLQIGTNDILSAYNDGITDRLENLINVILSDMTDPTDVVFVSTIPYMNVEEVYDWFWAYGDAYYNSDHEDFINMIKNYVDEFNASIKTLVEKMQSEGKSVRFADINSVINPETDLQDGVHPNETGYEKMGDYWYGMVTNFLSDEPEETTESNTQQETTEETTASPTDITDVTESATETTLVVTDPYETTTSVTETDITENSTESPDTVLGDINGDNYVNVVDMVKINKFLIRQDELTNEEITRA